MAKTAAWQRKEGKNPKGGLNAAGRRSAKAQGMNLKPPVSAKQAAKSPRSAARRKSFCARRATRPHPHHAPTPCLCYERRKSSAQERMNERAYICMRTTGADCADD
jgi:hypothetical protein